MVLVSGEAEDSQVSRPVIGVEDDVVAGPSHLTLAEKAPLVLLMARSLIGSGNELFVLLDRRAAGTEVVHTRLSARGRRVP